MKYNLVACGGTFDHFHKGHEEFLRYVFSVGKKVIVGATSDKYIESSKFKVLASRRSGQNPKLMEPFKARKKAVLEFVKKEKVLNKIEIVKIDDLFGPTLSKDLPIVSLVVSEDTKKGADIINKKREELGLKDLRILVSPLVLAEDGKLISSARIRNGEINRAGKLYIKPSWLKTDLTLPENLREELRSPLYTLVPDVSKDQSSFRQNLLVTVGDETSRKFNENSIKQNIAVVDFKIARKKVFSSFSELGFRGDEEIIVVNNPAGHVTSDLFNAILKIFQSNFENRIILKVIGEEDLTVLPMILAAPLDTIIYYGQPPFHPAQQEFKKQAGIIEIIVSEESKSMAFSLILKFKPI